MTTRRASIDTTAASGTVRVVIVDDQPDHRLLVRALLARRNGWAVVGEASDGLEALQVVERAQPDICILDLRMPNPGDEALPHILKVAPACMVAILSSVDEPDTRQHLMKLGAFACFPKSELDRFPDLLHSEYQRFTRALDGEDTLPSWLNGQQRA